MHERVQQAVNILQDILAGDGEVNVEEALTETLELLKPVPKAMVKIKGKLQEKMAVQAFSILGSMLEVDCDYSYNLSVELGVDMFEMEEAVKELIRNNGGMKSK